MFDGGLAFFFFLNWPVVEYLLKLSSSYGIVFLFLQRMHILGALEDLNEMGVSSSILQADRDFNE